MAGRGCEVNARAVKYTFRPPVDWKYDVTGAPDVAVLWMGGTPIRPDEVVIEHSNGRVYSARVAGPMVLSDGSVDADHRLDMSYYFGRTATQAVPPPEWLAQIIAEHAERVEVAR